jgi:hypothetical protein
MSVGKILTHHADLADHCGLNCHVGLVCFILVYWMMETIVRVYCLERLKVEVTYDLRQYEPR